MRVALVASCGITAAAVGAVALSAESLKMSITDRSSSEMTGVRVAQAAPPAGQPAPPAAEPGKPSADEPKSQPPQAAEPGKVPPADRPNGQADQKKTQAAVDRDDDDDDRRGADDDDRDDAED
jgi:hypothetical protein